MPVPLSNDLRKRISWSLAEGLSAKEISIKYDVVISTVYKLKYLINETGDYKPRENLNGRKPKLNQTDYQNIRFKIIENPSITLEELIDELDLPISPSQLCRIINKKLKLVRKKNSFSKRTEA